MDKAVDNPEQQPGAAPEEGRGAPSDVTAPEVAGAPEAAAPANDSAPDERTAEEQAGGAPEVGADEAAPAGGEPVAAATEPVTDEAAADEAAPDEAAPGKPHKRVLTGTVVSNGSEQSVVIRIAHRKKHRLYKKYRTLTKKVMAHDPANDCRVGDLVRVIESRPLSKMKRWRLVEIVKRAS
jgi:small subunit ribosomal protein S17